MSTDMGGIDKDVMAFLVCEIAKHRSGHEEIENCPWCRDRIDWLIRHGWAKEKIESDISSVLDEVKSAQVANLTATAIKAVRGRE